MNIVKRFTKYVSLNILGMIGLSCYILADTFFVSKALGATGIAALNFSISIYSIIHGIGLMIGIGGATRYSVLRSQQETAKANTVFTTSIKLGLCFSVLFVLLGIFGSSRLATLLGADDMTLAYTTSYLTTILCFSPFFISNNILLAFVRNDHNPKLSMIAMLGGSLSNVLLDYVFMFPLGWGMFGAAFATGLAPIISILILSFHVIKKKNGFKWLAEPMRWVVSLDIVKLGFAAFISELSSAIVLITFNGIIFGLEGNVGVASYAIVANLALVAASIFTGIAQGIQPLVSQAYGMNQVITLRTIIKYTLVTAMGVALLLYVTVFHHVDAIVTIFNSEQHQQIAAMARTGLLVYFLGFFFAGINMILAMYLSATEYTREAFYISIARGCIVIVPMAIGFSAMFGMAGIWLAFVGTEVVVMIMTMNMTASSMRMEYDKSMNTFPNEA